MMIRRFLLSLILFVCLSAQGKPLVTLRVRHLPTPVIIDGKPVIYYELWVTAAKKKPLTFNRLTLINRADASVIADFTGEDLKRRYVPLTLAIQPPASISPAVGLIYVEVALPAGQISSRLIHKLEVAAAGVPKTTVVEGGDMTLATPASIVLGQPLRGGPWVAIYDASWPRGHRRVPYTMHDTTRIPGRFAIDFIKLGEDIAMARGTEDSIANWYGYAADVLAVSDGVIAAVVNDFPESPTLSGHPHQPAEKAAGNYISLNIGHGRYVFYEHLKPGSVMVKPGQRVKKGEHIAALGFTGQTTGPHLHLHVADRNATLGAEGLPFALESFTLKSIYVLDPSQSQRQIPVATEKTLIKNERPVPQAVVVF